jgi:hypothetical protein
MARAAPLSEQPRRPSTSTDDRPTAPLEIFYVVHTTAGVIGKRHHRVCPPLYETRHQAQIELVHLQTASPTGGTYSIWKATTYVEPAEWLYDVVVVDGAVIRLGKRNKRLTASGDSRRVEPRPRVGRRSASSAPTDV